MTRTRSVAWLVHLWAAMLLVIPDAQAAAAPKRGKRSGQRVVAQVLRGVDRVTKLEFPIPANVNLPKARLLPGARVLQVDIPLPLVRVQRLVARVPKELRAHTEQLETSVRVSLTHVEHPILFSDGAASRRATGRNRQYVLLLGGHSEDTRLRTLADWVRLPLPVPTNLGAQLELWQEAARATSDRKIQKARRLWEKLGEQRNIRDLTELRIAELFIITGHVNEASKRLRSVARSHPRSTGAVLARISALHLEAITGDGNPTPEQALIAARSGNRPTFRGFAWLRTARALNALGAAEVAMENFPELSDLPENWRARAIAERNFTLERAIVEPMLRGDLVEMLAQYEAWQPMAATHDDPVAMAQLVGDAYMDLALYESAVPHLRRQLAAFPEPDEEARIVSQLAKAYHGIGERDHELTSLRFLLEHHGAAPGIGASIRALATRELQTRGVDAARTLLANLRSKVTAPNLQRVILAVEADLMEAWGSNGQLITTLTAMQRIGYDDPDRRGPALAAALARDGRAEPAVPLLRNWIGRTTDPERRDELAYLLADAELALGNETDGRAILDDLSTHGTHWGLVARARLRERALRVVIAELAAQYRKLADEGNTP